MGSLEMTFEPIVKHVNRFNHMLGIFPNRIDSINYAASFFYDGIQNDEAVLYASDYSKNDLCSNLQQLGIDLKELENTNRFLTKSSYAWYDDISKQTQPNKKWMDIQKQVGCDVNGLRIFAEMTSFFESNRIKNVIDHESTLPEVFNMPITAICAYTYDDMTMVDKDQFHTLLDHHKKILL